jgi:antimicrobial peptide system SdpA family protein
MALSLTQLLPARWLPQRSSTIRTNLAAMWPQGWGFFAHEPDGDVPLAFRVDAQGQALATDQRMMSLNTLFGVNRAAFAQFAELDTVISQAPQRSWIDCTGLTPSQCRAAALRTPATSQNTAIHDPVLCGHVLVALGTPQRWTTDTKAWLEDWKILRILNTEIQCAA